MIYLSRNFCFLHIFWLSLTAFFSRHNFTVVSHDLHQVTQEEGCERQPKYAEKTKQFLER